MLFTPAPPGLALPDSAERKPSGILSALVFDHGASVSSSFPSRLNLGGAPLLRRRSLNSIPHLPCGGRAEEDKRLWHGGAAHNVQLPRALM